MEENIKRCGQCAHYLGGGDFNLCCDVKQPEGLFGFLCYATTPACAKFTDKNIDIQPYNYFKETMDTQGL